MATSEDATSAALQAALVVRDAQGDIWVQVAPGRWLLSADLRGGQQALNRWGTTLDEVIAYGEDISEMEVLFGGE